MGIYNQGEYTLVRLRLKHGLYVRVTKEDHAQVVINTPTPASTLQSMALAWTMYQSEQWGVQPLGSEIVDVARYGYEATVTIRDTLSGMHRVSGMADYLPLASRIVKIDPARTYEPVRRLVVSSGMVMIRHHEAATRASAIRQEVAYRRIIERAGEAKLVQLLTEGNIAS